MRHLKKSLGLLPCGWNYVLGFHKSNTSTKPFSRLIHSLAVRTYGENAQRPRPAQVQGELLTRAERRAHLQKTFNTKPYSPEELQSAGLGAAPTIRKLTGAVRRGLERGRVA